MSAVWLYLRLGAALGLLLLPGGLIARALGVAGLAAALAWSLGALFAAMTLTFLLGASSTLTLLLLAGVALAALLVSSRRPAPASIPGLGGVAAAGVVLGILLWHVAGEVGGDGLFHLARVRKLAELDELSLGALEEFPDGGPHPGYAFPLWHGFLALVARLSGADPAEVVLHLPSLLAPVAVVLAYEAAWALFRRRAAAGAAAATSVALIAMAPGHGGAYAVLSLPATSSRQLLVPAALALALAAVRAPSAGLYASAAAAAFALAVVHPTYAIFLWVPFAGFVAVRYAWTRLDGRAGLLALAALVVPAALFFAWLYPLIRDTASVAPDAAERARALRQYAGQLNVRSNDSYSLAAEVFGRAGAAAVGALLLVPLAGLAARRRWAAYVVGGSLAVLLLLLVPALFTPFSDAVSLSQARRAAGFLPFAFALAGGAAVAARLLGRTVLPLALGAGIALQLLYAGDFDYVLDDGGPRWATWVAVLGGVAALLVGFRRARLRPLEAATGAAFLFLLPAYVHGLASWSPSDARPPSPFTPGLVAAVRELPEGAVVYSDPEASYRLAAAAPVYVCIAPPAHVADTQQNRPYERVDEFRRLVRTGDLAAVRACGAGWLVVDRDRFDLEPDAAVAYRDGRYTLYRLGNEP